MKYLIKKIIWRLKNKKNFTHLVGHNFPLNRVSVGKMTYGNIHAVSFGNPKERLEIGSFCSIADNVVFLLGGEHNLDAFSTYPFKAKFLKTVEAGTKGPIIVEDDVWIGFNSTILSGVRIGQGAVIGAGAVVNKDVAPYEVVGGVPAKHIKNRFEDSLIKKLMQIDFKKIDKNTVKALYPLFEKKLTEENLAELANVIGVNE